MQNIKIAIVDGSVNQAENTKSELRKKGFRKFQIFNQHPVSEIDTSPDIVLMDINDGSLAAGRDNSFCFHSLNIPVLYLSEDIAKIETNEIFKDNVMGCFLRNSDCQFLSDAIVEILKGKKKNFYINFSSKEFKWLLKGIDKSDEIENRLISLYDFNHETKPSVEKRNFINILENRSTDRVSVNKLIEQCFKIAKSQINHNFNKILNIAYRWDLNGEDLALEAISSLFVKNEKRGKLNIFVSFERWADNIETEGDAIYFLHKIVETSVNQHIHKLLKDGDPLFSKVLDSITHQIKKNKYKKIKHLGRTYVAKDCVKTNETIFIEVEEIENTFIEKLESAKDLLEQVFGIFKNGKDVNIALPLNAVINKVTDFHKNTYDNPTQKNANYLEELFVKEILEKVSEKIVSEIYHSYLEKGKINVYCANILEQTINNILNDVRDGKKIIGLYKYLNHVAPEITQDVYSEKYQNILEYLYKKLKIYLVTLLRKN